MKRTSAKKLCILGLVLTIVSAVTAAIVPAKSSDAKFDGSLNNGSLRNNSGAGGTGGGKSCFNDNDVINNCHWTKDTATGAVSLNANGFETVNNTSVTTPGNGHDTTSTCIDP